MESLRLRETPVQRAILRFGALSYANYPRRKLICIDKWSHCGAYFCANNGSIFLHRFCSSLSSRFLTLHLFATDLWNFLQRQVESRHTHKCRREEK